MASNRYLRVILPISISILLGSIAAVNAQPIEWEQTYTMSIGDIPASIIQTTSGEYIIAGTAYRQGLGLSSSQTSTRTRVDAHGAVKWSFGASPLRLNYGLAGYIAAFTLKTGEYLLVGHTETPQGINLMTTTIDDEGKEIGSYTIAEPDSLRLITAARTADGGFLIVGKKMQAAAAASNDLVIYKLNRDIILDWKKTLYHFEDPRTGAALAAAADGGYLVASQVGQGGSATMTQAQAFTYLGNPLWQINDYSRVDGYMCAAMEASDGGYLIAYVTLGPSDSTLNVTKIDAEGHETWTQSYTNLARDGRSFQPAGMIRTSSGYAIGGITGDDPAVLHINATGEPLGYSVYPHPADPSRRITALTATNDGGILLAGTNSTGTLLIKLGKGVAGVKNRSVLPNRLFLY